MNGAPHSNHGQLGVWDTVGIIVGIVIGTTIFAMPWLVFLNTPNPWMGLAVWVFGGLLALIGGLCYAELGATYPRAGGDYYYLTQAFGRFVGFLFGWAQLIVILPANIGLMAYVFATVASDIHKMPDFANLELSSEFYYAAMAVLAISLLNMIGVTLGKWSQNILTLAKIVGLLAILICGFISMQPGASDWSLPKETKDLGWGVLAMIFVMFAYGGWNDAAFVAAEIREPQRNIPRALMIGIGLITVIYVLVNLAYILGLGFDTVQKSDKDSLPTQLLHNVFGDKGAAMMRAIIMASALGAVNGLIFAGSRVYASLGKDHRLFGIIGHWSPGRGAPVLALFLQALITLGFIFLFGTDKGHNAINQSLDSINGSLTSVVQHIDDAYEVNIKYLKDWKPGDAFEALVAHSAPAFWLFFLLTGLSLFVLRENNPVIGRPFSVPWYPLLPIIFCNSCVFMLYRSVLYIEWRSLFVVILLLLGFPLYWLSQGLGVPRRDD